MFDTAVLLASMVLFLSIFMIGGLIADKIEEVFYDVHGKIPERTRQGRRA